MNTEYISDVEVEVNVVDNGVVSLVVEALWLAPVK